MTSNRGKKRSIWGDESETFLVSHMRVLNVKNQQMTFALEKRESIVEIVGKFLLIWQIDQSTKH